MMMMMMRRRREQQVMDGHSLLVEVVA